MNGLTSTLTRFHAELMTNTPSPALLVRAARLGRLSAAGRVFEITPDRPSSVLRRMILESSKAFPVMPGILPFQVLAFVHGTQAVGATLCYGTARRARYLIREVDGGQVIFRNLKGTEHVLSREEALALFRGYRMTDVFLMPVPADLTTPQPVEGKRTTAPVPTPAAVPAAVPTAPPPRPAFQSRRPAFSGPRAAGRSA